jgi:hypothetical protein
MKPTGEDRVEPGWRPIDEAMDSIEEPQPGTDYSLTYPDDPTALYYWRPTYWRSQKKL